MFLINSHPFFFFLYHHLNPNLLHNPEKSIQQQVEKENLVENKKKTLYKI